MVRQPSLFQADEVRLTAAIGRFGLRVRDLNRPLGRGHASERGSGDDREHRKAPARLDERRRCRAVQRDRAEGVALEEIQHAELGRAHAHRVRQHGLEHRLELARRARDDAEHLRGRGLLLQRFGQLPARLREARACVNRAAASDIMRDRRVRATRVFLFVPLERSLRPCDRLFAPLRDKAHLGRTSIDPECKAEVAPP